MQTFCSGYFKDIVFFILCNSMHKAKQQSVLSFILHLDINVWLTNFALNSISIRKRSKSENSSLELFFFSQEIRLSVSLKFICWWCSKQRRFCLIFLFIVVHTFAEVQNKMYRYFRFYGQIHDRSYIKRILGYFTIFNDSLFLPRA